MLQELITYLIVGIAVYLSISKVLKRFKKKKPQKIDFKNETFSLDHNCSACSADCSLRNQPKQVIEQNKELCSDNQNFTTLK